METIVDVLLRESPKFHHVSRDGVAAAAAAGVAIPEGDVSMAISPGALRWIADHLRADMTTLETGAGHTTVVFAALGRHHYCCTFSAQEQARIREFMARHGIPDKNLTVALGSTDETLAQLRIGQTVDFALIDGCHGYPFPALDWHFVDRYLKVGGILGMDNVELRPVREHCEFLEENGSYRLMEVVCDGCFARFYEKRADQGREWIEQPYSRAKRDACDWRLWTRIRRRGSRWIKRYLL